MLRHFTATAFVINSKKQILLLWHIRLQRWMPPGGHIDPNETPQECARRECKEETGLDVEIIGDPNQPNVFAHAHEEGKMLIKPFAMLCETIPPYDKPTPDGIKHEPAHEHMDFLFLAKPLDESQPLERAEAEADHLRWFTKEEIAEIPDEKIFKNVRAYINALS